MKAGLATSLSIAGVLATGGAALVLNSSILDTESSAKGSPAFATVVGVEAAGAITQLGDGASPGGVSELSANAAAGAITQNLDNPLVVAADATSPTAPLSEDASGSTPTSGSPTWGSMYRGSGSIRQTQTNLSPSESTVAPSPSPSTPDVTPTTNSPSDTAAPATTLVPAIEKQFRVGDAATITLIVSGTKLLVKDIAIVPGSGYKVTNQTSRDGDDVRITLTSPANAVEFSARLVNGQIMAAVSAPSSGNLTPPPPPRRHDDDEDDDDEHDEDEREHDDDHEEREHDDDD